MKKNIVLVGVLAAMVCVATTFLHVPIVGGGYVHMGDAVIYLAAALLPVGWIDVLDKLEMANKMK